MKHAIVEISQIENAWLATVRDGIRYVKLSGETREAAFDLACRKLDEWAQQEAEMAKAWLTPTKAFGT